MSELQTIHDQLTNLKHVVVCVDPVDLDNIWMSLWALVRAPNAHIHISLSPRVLDLRVPTFASLFPELNAKVGSHYMLDTQDEDAEEVYGLLGDEGLRAYFARDTTFQADAHTRTHVPLYMALSALRFALKFSSKGHVGTRYTFYWDPRSMESIIPGIHHPAHVNDFLYACNDEDRRESSKYLHLAGQEREERMVEIMQRTANRLAGQLGYEEPLDILNPIEKLIELFKGPAAASRTLVLGGGPFTEMVRLLKETDMLPLAVVAMSRTWWADVNVFPNNYNDLMDLDAAMEIEDLVKERAVPTWFFPTECAKAKVEGSQVLRRCAWDFDMEQLKSIFRDAGDMESYEQAAVFTRETKTLAKMHLFDVLTVVPLAHPGSLPYRRAESYWDEVDGQRVIRIKEAADGPVNVFYPDEEAMKASQKTAMEEISYVLSSVKGSG
ncbi:hypothetical protein B0H34DRAFT_673759 [Crassisporium funariophilum]|nr:hypothetical protein B0H34DRAFT_673759 [Crassisporium funariophilum]